MTLVEARRLTMTMVSTGDAATAATPEFVPLSKHIGCEVKGIDLREPLRPDTISAIYRAWLDHAVLLFRSEEHTSELQSHSDLVCRLLLEKKKIGVIVRSSRCRGESDA